jgi:hypothetical protein
MGRSFRASGARSAALSQKNKKIFFFFSFFQKFRILSAAAQHKIFRDWRSSAKKLSQQQAKPLAVASRPSLLPFPTPISAVEAKAKALPLGLRNQSVE